MFGERSPLEKEHGLLMEAVRMSDPGMVRQVLERCPQAAQPHSYWSQSPFQLIAGNMHSFSCTDAALDCMEALLEHGASPMQSHKYYPIPMETILKRGVVKAVERMARTGHLAQYANSSLGAVGLAQFICNSNTWRDNATAYPLLELMKVFVEAGADVTKGPFEIDGKPFSAIKSLLFSSRPQYGFPRPASMEDTCLFLLEHDQETPMLPEFVMQAYNAGFKRAFAQVVQRYQAQGHSMEDIQGRAEKMNPTERAHFEAWVVEARTPRAPSSDTRRPGARL